MRRPGVLLLALAAVAGCGEDEREEPATRPPPATATTATTPATQLTIEMDADGSGGTPPQRATLRCPEQAQACALLDEDALEPPTDQVCTEQYGGPETATIRGTLEGRPVDAGFSRTNGCEIDRYERIRPLLDALR